MRILSSGDHALLVEVDGLDQALGLYAHLRRRMKVDSGFSRAVTSLVPAATTVLLVFDPGAMARKGVESVILGWDGSAAGFSGGRRVRVPVVYDGEDIEEVAGMLDVSVQEVVSRHAGTPWTAAFVGFAPGFAYLAGGDPLFDVPRRATPRLHVPAGAVGLAGAYSGVYPRDSSGGWRLIGVTDVPLWDETAEPPALIRPGDVVEFVPVRARAVTADSDAATSDGSPTAQDVEGAHAGSASASQGVASEDAGCDEGPSAGDDTGGRGLRDERPGIRVLSAGMATLIEDDGRSAADMGVTGSGAADAVAFHTANSLVGNPGSAPALEITGGGASFTAIGDLVVAVAGAQARVTIRTAGGTVAVIRDQRPLLLLDGETLRIGALEKGWRDYVALRGGIRVSRVLGSASTDTMSGIGPRPLAVGDVVTIAGESPATVGSPLPWAELPASGGIVGLGVVPGPRDDWFTTDSLDAFLDSLWTVTARSNRVGLRLEGGSPLVRRRPEELQSEGTVPGALEIPSDGRPVLFLCDQPVTGGYPVVAVLDRESLSVAAQLPPGARVRFRLVGVGDGRERSGPRTATSASASKVFRRRG